MAHERRAATSRTSSTSPTSRSSTPRRSAAPRPRRSRPTTSWSSPRPSTAPSASRRATPRRPTGRCIPTLGPLIRLGTATASSIPYRITLDFDVPRRPPPCAPRGGLTHRTRPLHHLLGAAGGRAAGVQRRRGAGLRPARVRRGPADHREPAAGRPARSSTASRASSASTATPSISFVPDLGHARPAGDPQPAALASTARSCGRIGAAGRRSSIDAQPDRHRAGVAVDRRGRGGAGTPRRARLAAG